MNYQEFKYMQRSMKPWLTCKVIKEMYNKMATYELPGVGFVSYPDTIASCEPAMPTVGWNISNAWNNNQEGEKPMCYKCKPQAFEVTSVVAASAPVSVEATQRDFANSRVNQIREKHQDKLREQFFMDVEVGPRTARDLIKAIKEDDFTLDEKALTRDEDTLQYFHNQFGIRWGKNKPDQKGYDAARQALKEKAQEVIDTVTLGSIEEARQALDAFKTWTYSA